MMDCMEVVEAVLGVGEVGLRGLVLQTMYGIDVGSLLFGCKRSPVSISN